MSKAFRKVRRSWNYGAHFLSAKLRTFNSSQTSKYFARILYDRPTKVAHNVKTDLKRTIFFHNNLKSAACFFFIYSFNFNASEYTKLSTYELHKFSINQCGKERAAKYKGALMMRNMRKWLHVEET